MPSPPQPLDVHIQLPEPNDNLFDRLIRNPQAPDRPMREVQCSEMLRTVLVTCPTLKLFVLNWLGRMAYVNRNEIESLDWSLETEQSIGSKRDDLRIQGWTSEGRRAVLWTVEIKVAAPLHESSKWDEENGETVNQLQNYDSWLSQRNWTTKADPCSPCKTWHPPCRKG